MKDTGRGTGGATRPIKEAIGPKVVVEKTEKRKEGFQRKKGRQMTTKQRMYMRNRMKGMNKRESALKAGYSESTALSVRNVENGALRREMATALTKKGLTSGKLADTLMEGLLAEDRWGNTDHHTRLEFAKVVMELMGWMKEEEAARASITINLDGDVARKYEKKQIEGEVIS